MRLEPTHNNESIQLPAVLAIGFTGHRTLPDEAASRQWIDDVLAETKRSTSGILLGVSSVAAGGDLLFAESCIALGIPLRVLLPFPAEEFRNDFDPATWIRAQQAMGRALSVEVTGKELPRDEAYYECGLATVLKSQWQLALWNGEPAQGLGGTEQIVTFARQIGRPVIWIHSVTGVIQRSDQKKLPLHDGDPELTFLNQLPSSGVSLADSSPRLYRQHGLPSWTTTPSRWPRRCDAWQPCPSSAPRWQHSSVAPQRACTRAASGLL